MTFKICLEFAKPSSKVTIDLWQFDHTNAKVRHNASRAIITLIRNASIIFSPNLYPMKRPLKLYIRNWTNWFETNILAKVWKFKRLTSHKCQVLTQELLQNRLRSSTKLENVKIVDANGIEKKVPLGRSTNVVFWKVIPSFYKQPLKVHLCVVKHLARFAVNDEGFLDREFRITWFLWTAEAKDWTVLNHSVMKLLTVSPMYSRTHEDHSLNTIPSLSLDSTGSLAVDKIICKLMIS